MEDKKMIHLIYGAKGSGKTVKIMDAVNDKCKGADANVVFITDNDRSLGIDKAVRFVNVKEYDIKWDCCLVAFLKGMLAANSDNTAFYIDGISRFTKKKPEELEELMSELEDISAKFGVDLTLIISTDTLPKFMMKYV